MKSKVMSVIRFFLILVILACIAILGKRLLDYRTNANNNKELANVVKEVEDEMNHDQGDSTETIDPWEQKHQHYIKALSPPSEQF